MLRNWYHIAEQRAKILHQWQNIKLSEEVDKRPE